MLPSMIFWQFLAKYGPRDIAKIVKFLYQVSIGMMGVISYAFNLKKSIATFHFELRCYQI